jgi:hypothetical protein
VIECIFIVVAFFYTHETKEKRHRRGTRLCRINLNVGAA